MRWLGVQAECFTAASFQQHMAALLPGSHSLSAVPGHGFSKPESRGQRERLAWGGQRGSKSGSVVEI